MQHDKLKVVANVHDDTFICFKSYVEIEVSFNKHINQNNTEIDIFLNETISIQF